VEQVYEALLRRAEEAVAEAHRQHRRAAELMAFVAELRESTPAGIVVCAWCGNVASGGRWIDPAPLLAPRLRQRLEEQATHGICPSCLNRVSAEVAAERADNRP